MRFANGKKIERLIDIEIPKVHVESYEHQLITQQILQHKKYYQYRRKVILNNKDLTKQEKEMLINKNIKTYMGLVYPLLTVKPEKINYTTFRNKIIPDLERVKKTGETHPTYRYSSARSRLPDIVLKQLYEEGMTQVKIRKKFKILTNKCKYNKIYNFWFEIEKDRNGKLRVRLYIQDPDRKIKLKDGSGKFKKDKNGKVIKIKGETYSEWAVKRKIGRPKEESEKTTVHVKGYK